MKLVSAVIIILAAFAAASSSIEGHWEGTITPWPATDDIIDSNPLSGPIYSTAYAVFGDYWVADDLLVTFTATVETVTYWILSTGTMPTSLNVYFLDDGDPGPGVELWSESTTDLTFNNSGVTFAGYVIYIGVMNLPNTDYFVVNPGVTYWTGFHRDDGVNLYVILDTEVNGTECYRIITASGPWVPGSTTGYDPTDLLRIIEGTIALDRDTWGALKTLF